MKLFATSNKLPNLVDLGWTFDLADYGYENGYIMNQDDKTYATIELENPLYSDDLRCMLFCK